MSEQYFEAPVSAEEARDGIDSTGALEPRAMAATVPLRSVSYTGTQYDDMNFVVPSTSSAGLPTVPWMEPE